MLGGVRTRGQLLSGAGGVVAYGEQLLSSAGLSSFHTVSVLMTSASRSPSSSLPSVNKALLEGDLESTSEILKRGGKVRQLKASKFLCQQVWSSEAVVDGEMKAVHHRLIGYLDED
ncbi:uncharacterized protein [Miscanthus floridulus]|uniref:uncharacterized protein n=1 Tax=Miscanthus floridulus TaxID=154761 RepID=UPI003457811B